MNQRNDANNLFYIKDESLYNNAYNLFIAICDSLFFYNYCRR